MSLSTFISYYLVYLFFFPCVVTYFLFAWDKHLAYYKRTRVPEAVLLIASLFMGAFGALCAMILFRHKTDHKAFTIGIPVITTLQLAAVILIKVYA